MMAYHAGPAGSRFYDIEDAGRHMLKINCNNYPCTTNSYILPPIFLSQFPEEYNPTTLKVEPRVAPPLSGKEQKKLDGISSGQSGEKTEYKVFYLFSKLLEEEQDVPVLVLRDFELDTKGKRNLKRKTLMSEYPQITNIDMHGQQDCIIFLKDLGFICIEIKRTLSAESVQKAKEQLDRSESFLNDIMAAITTNSYRLPILKLVMFEMDDPQHSLALNSPDYHFFDCSGDSITAFKLIWINLKQELQSKLPANPLTSLEFKRLARLLTGLWSMKSLNRQTYFDVNDASATHLTTQADVSVDHAHLCSGAKKVKNTKKDPKDPPVTNVVYNPLGTVFREAKNINLIYLTPEQKNICDNIRCGIIRGAAGTGKTLLILFKIIYLVQSHDNRKIILVAPHPHTLRCKKILEANGVRVKESEDIPPKTETLYDVVIMGIHGLHSLLSSPLSASPTHHLFIDDLQSSFGRDDDFSHLDVELIKARYEIATQNNVYFWCMDDSLQQKFSSFDKEPLTKTFFEDLYSTAKDDAIVPTYTLENILRNTQEISNVVLKARHSANVYHQLPSVAAHSSHNITSTLPVFHALDHRIEPSDDEVRTYRALYGLYDNVYFRIDFCVERIEDELRTLLCATNPIPLSDIAVLYDARVNISHNIDRLLNRTREMLSTVFNIIPMTIEQQLKTGSPKIVIDDVKNASSGEWPVVIYFHHDGNSFTSPYIGLSRARTRLIVINGMTFTSTISHLLANVALVKWKWENCKFVRAVDNLS